MNNQFTLPRASLHVAERWQVIEQFFYNGLKIPSQRKRFLEKVEVRNLSYAPEDLWKRMTIIYLSIGIRIEKMISIQ